MPGETDAWTRARQLRDTARTFSRRASAAADPEVRSHYQQIADGYSTLADAEESLILRATKDGLPRRG